MGGGRQRRRSAEPVETDDRRWWSVLVEVDESPPGTDHQTGLDLAAFHRFADLLEPHHGVSSVGVLSWGSRIALVADTALEAVGLGLELVTGAARRAGLQDLPVSSVEAVRWDVFERSLE